MSQDQKSKEKIEAKPEHIIHIKLPMVRNFSTGGGHGPEDTLIEGDQKLVTKKWQGYPPDNLNLVGKPMPPIPEVAIPRYTGKAQYATRVMFPNMLWVKPLTSPHPRARIRNIDTSKAEQMPGVAYVLTYKNAPRNYPMPQELGYFGEIVAFVAAETEDLAEDAAAMIEVDYEVLPFAATLKDTMSPNAPDLRGQGRGNMVPPVPPNQPHYDPNATWMAKRGDVEKGFAEADIVRQFTYTFAGATCVPLQPAGGVAMWEGDKLTFWGMSQGTYPQRATLAKALEIDEKQVRYINKWNGGTFQAGQVPQWLNPYSAHIARMTRRPVKLMFSKDQELGFLGVKPETVSKFKVGAKKDGRIVALVHEIHLSMGFSNEAGMARTGSAKNQTILYTSNVPHWKSSFFAFKSNVIRATAVRSNAQQEIKWAWENMIDEMAEAVGMDPIKFRMMHVPKPGTTLSPASDWDDEELGGKFESLNGALTYDAYGSVEVLEEGAKAIGWDKRNPVPGGNPGRFKRGIGLGMGQHHAGHIGYHQGEMQFEKRLAEIADGTARGPHRTSFNAEVELDAQGYVTLKQSLPCSGTNHDTAMATLVAEILGFTTRDRVRVIWGDTDLTPSAPGWGGGWTTTQQGGALCSAADKLRKNLLFRAGAALKVDPATLQIRDGVISSTEDPRKRTTFAALAKANQGFIRQTGMTVMASGRGRGLIRGVGACFLEVEVDTWTGDWRIVRSVYCHDTGKVINPLLAEADMHGSLVQSTQMTTDALPWDREFPGTRHYSVGFLSYRIPTIMDVPEEQTNVFVDTLEPRWFFGYKSFAETSIGSVPGAIANAIYNACGVRIREHPITKEKILAGLKAKQRRS